MFNYLYYKLYQAALKSSLYDIPVFMTAVSFGSLISANILVINGFLSNTLGLPFLFSRGVYGGLFAFLLIVLTMIYFSKDKRKLILQKYVKEPNRERIRGNTIVAIYVVLSFLLIFVVAFLKPGKV